MNKKKLLHLGLHPDCVGEAIKCIQVASDAGEAEHPKRVIPLIIESPETFLADSVWKPLAESIIAAGKPHVFEPIGYLSWGQDLDENSLRQMENACRLPVSRAAALMPDAHVGYGLPIGGVLACENAVVPYGVGVDIACRVKLTITDLPVMLLDENEPSVCRELDAALAKGTVFGTGGRHKNRQQHEVMDEDWTVTAVTREMRDRAWDQLGTSGSGNHFVEWGIVELPDASLGVELGRYVGLLSHSGSRGTGAQVCQRYTTIARQNAPSYIRNDPQLCHLAWLEMDTEAGQEYWAAMNLMGRYAAANHAIIHRNVVRLAGGTALATVENHHNFAWLERHGDRDLYVHRKGATPAGVGDLGIIPGNMADTCFIVRGKGESRSLNSASHGAGRRMSRTAAKKQYRWRDWTDHLKERKVRLLAGGIDEVPGVYKDIREVMAAQTDLVDPIGQFTPRIVMMCGDDSPAED
ncbi:MAG: RtcB family protein [Pirellulaceae bacterium]